MRMTIKLKLAATFALAFAFWGVTTGFALTYLAAPTPPTSRRLNGMFPVCC